MKTVCYLDAECPKCPKPVWEGSSLPPGDRTMYVDGDNTVQCMEPGCELFQVKFKRPSVEIELERI